MKSLFKKLMDKLRYGSEDEEIENEAIEIDDEASKKSDTTQSEQKKQTSTSESSKGLISNIIELNELGIQAIINSMSAIKYSDVRLSEIRLHLRNGKQAPTSLAADKLFQSEKFMSNLKYKLSDAGIQYMDQIKTKIIFSSPQIDNFTKLSDEISIQTLTFEESRKQQKLIISALTGFLWENEIELTPRKKPYFIGRCKMPVLDRSAVISNDIAFIGPEEMDDPRYEINRLVSRSIAKIVYNEENGNFELMRSNLLNNNQHVIKIVRIIDGINQISINNTEVGYPLRDDDQIVFNEKVALLVNVVEMDNSLEEKLVF